MLLLIWEMHLGTMKNIAESQMKWWGPSLRMTAICLRKPGLNIGGRRDLRGPLLLDGKPVSGFAGKKTPRISQMLIFLNFVFKSWTPNFSMGSLISDTSRQCCSENGVLLCQCPGGPPPDSWLWMPSEEKKVRFLALLFHYLTVAGWQQSWNKLTP